MPGPEIWFAVGPADAPSISTVMYVKVGEVALTDRMQFVTLSAKMSVLATGWYKSETGNRMATSGFVWQSEDPLVPPMPRNALIVNSFGKVPESFSTRMRLFP